MLRRRLLCFNDDAKSFIIFPTVLQCLWIIIGLYKIFSKKDKRSSIGNLLVMLFVTAIFNVLLGKSYIEMLNGCDIGKWHYAEDEFSQALAANIGINEYTELKYWLKTTDGYPIINVQIVDGKANVVLENAITRY